MVRNVCFAAAFSAIVASCAGTSELPSADFNGGDTENIQTGSAGAGTALVPFEGSGEGGGYQLRTFTTGGADVRITRHQLFFKIVAKDWLLLDRALRDGKAFNLGVLERNPLACDTPPCGVEEHVSMDFSDDEVKALAENGLAAELTGRQGRRAVIIPATFFQQYLDGLKQT